ncbi:MAG: EAL domain-containing protein [Tissierellaceae bacterium]|nr:EAL domain-containing protein [Tissierellaceae bacterium]
MPNKKDINWFQHNMEFMENQVEDYLKTRLNTNPAKEALKIIALYIIIGALWITLSDTILGNIVKDSEMYKTLQLYKGWLYVAVTAMFFYAIILKSLRLFGFAMDKIYDTYEELVASHEELIAMEGALKDQYSELEKNKNELTISNKRYEMIVDGAHDGIWDWDLVNEIYFFSLANKDIFGYSEGELNHDIEEWRGLMHPDDVKEAFEYLDQYLASKEGYYSNNYRIRTKGGEYRWIASSGRALWNKDGVPIRIAGSHTDITEQKIMEQKLYELAYFDQLTKLPNLEWLKEKGEELINQAKKDNKELAFLYVDVDDFRNINEIMGHEIGDKLIVHISNTVLGNIRSPHLVARLGGDEFGVFLVDIDRDTLMDKIEDNIQFIRKPWVLEGHTFYITISVGIAIFPDNGNNFLTLLQNADTALSFAKESGKDRCMLFTQEMQENTKKFVEMDSDLRIALENQEFQLYYQPQFYIKTNEVVGAEALIRWKHPKRGFIPPMEFIPFAEKIGYIDPISKWVFETACKQKLNWNKEGYKPLKISINLSGEMLSFAGLVQGTMEILEENEIEDFGIEIELTETALMADFENSVQVLEELKDLNITISLDDFGTGYSSLTYLRVLPIDVIKIDRQFINGIGKSDKEDDIIKYIIELSHMLGLKVVAEGVETKEQLDFLRENNCDIAQGYYFARPMPSEKMKKYLSK